MSYPRRFVGTVTTIFHCRQTGRPFPRILAIRFPRVPQGWPFWPPSGWGSASCSPPPGVSPVQVSAFSHPPRPPSSLRGSQEFSRIFPVADSFLTSSDPHAGNHSVDTEGGWGMIPELVCPVLRVSYSRSYVGKMVAKGKPISSPEPAPPPR